MLPLTTESDVGEAEMVKLGGGRAVTFKLTVIEFVVVPAVPVMVIGYVPVVVPAATVRVRVDVPEPGAAMDAGLKPAVTPVGRPDADKAIAELKPFRAVVVIVEVPLLPCNTESEVGEAEREKLAPAAPANALIRPVPFGLPQPVAKS